jgi:hypothetical protein
MVLGWWPIGFLIRHVMDQDLTYDHAVQQFSTTNIMAPCYLVITGAQPNQGTLLTRKRTGTLQPLTLDQRQYIVQTNIDHWVHLTDPKWAGTDELLQNALERRIQATQNLQTFQGTDYLSFAFDIMSKFPTCNDQTVYQVIMHPAKNIYVTRVVVNPPAQYSSARHPNSDHLQQGHYQPEYYTSDESEKAPLRKRNK